jgi:V8-like Glu-specific endopeptidase
MGNYAVWTAGHCVHDGSNSSAGWSTNFVFVPGYKAGRAPFGQWTADHLWTKTRWAQLGDLAYDMGGGVMNTKGGKKISQAVGWLGFSYNRGLNQHWHAIGYPQAAPFNGKFQWICTSSYAYSYGAGNPQPVGIGCDLTGGSSGGPWIVKFQGNAGASNYINGVNSFRRTSKPKEMFSPYHGSAAYSLWRELKNDTP